MNRLLQISKLAQQIGLYLLCAFLPFSNSAIEITFGILLFGWLIERGIQKGLHGSIWSTRSARFCGIAVVVYLVWAGLTYFWSTQPILSWNGWYRKTLEYVLFFIIVADVVKDRVILKRAVFILLISALVLVGDSIAQEILKYDPIRGHQLDQFNLVGEFSRMTGPFTDPNSLSGYLLPMIPIALCVGWGKSIRSWWGWLVFSPIIIACLVRTGSDAALLGLIVMFVILWLVHRPLRLPLSIGVVIMMLFVGDKLLHQLQLVLSFSFEADAGLRDRYSMWGAAWGMIRTHPFLGTGLNTFMDNYIKYCEGTCFGPSYAHNTFLQVAAETGAIGLVTFLGILSAMFCTWIKGLKGFFRSQDGVKWILMGLGLSIVAYMVQTTFETTFYMLRLATLFWVVCGMMVGLSFSITEDSSQDAPGALS